MADKQDGLGKLGAKPSGAETAVNLAEALGLNDNKLFADPKLGGTTKEGEPIITFTRVGNTDVEKVAQMVEKAMQDYDKQHGTKLDDKVTIIYEPGGKTISFKVKEMTPEVVKMLDTAINEAGTSRQQTVDKQRETQLKKQVSEAMGIEKVADAVPGIGQAEFKSGVQDAITYKVKPGVDGEALDHAIQDKLEYDKNLDVKLDVRYDGNTKTISFAVKSLDDPYVQSNLKDIMKEAGLNAAIEKIATQQPSKTGPAKPPQETSPPQHNKQDGIGDTKHNKQDGIGDPQKEPARQAVQGTARPLIQTPPAQSQTHPKEDGVGKPPEGPKPVVGGPQTKPLLVGGNAPAKPAVIPTPEQKQPTGQSTPRNQTSTEMTPKEISMVAALQGKGLTYDKPSPDPANMPRPGAGTATTGVNVERVKEQAQKEGR